MTILTKLYENCLYYILLQYSMSAVLISYSQPQEGAITIQDSVAFCARVSNPANQNNT